MIQEAKESDHVGVPLEGMRNKGMLQGRTRQPISRAAGFLFANSALQERQDLGILEVSSGRTIEKIIHLNSA